MFRNLLIFTLTLPSTASSDSIVPTINSVQNTWTAKLYKNLPTPRLGVFENYHLLDGDHQLHQNFPDGTNSFMISPRKESKAAKLEGMNLGKIGYVV